ncbi:flagellar hook-associated protein FlgK [Peptococcaceae bacterium]|nr:flagellar hook-associated protein FlgK [Peptococcaceae bacterium]
MPTGTFFGIETARRGMNVHKRAIDVVGHNLANAGTLGYSRQKAVKVMSDSFAMPHINSSANSGQFGTGVEIEMIRRVRDEYLDANVRKSFTSSHYWEDQLMVLARAEAVFAEPSVAGISDRIVEMFKAWMHLENTPQDPGSKAALVELADELASLMQYTYDQLDSIEESIAKINGSNVIRGQLKDQVDRINEIVQQIQNLTKSIVRIYDTGQQPNDLLDKRDMLLEELSKFGPVDVVFETVNGKPTGKFEVFKFFVFDLKDDINNTNVATTAFSLSATDNNEIKLQYSGSSYNLTTNRNDTATGGSLLGLERARQNIIEFKSNLNNLAASLRYEINNTLGAYVATDPHPEFFTGLLRTGDFRVNDELKSDPTKIDGTRAGYVADLRDDASVGYNENIIGDVDGDGIKEDKTGENNAALGTSTFEEYFAMLVTKVGAVTKSAGEMAENQKAIHDQILALRDSISGVSIDEELTKMLQFQYGFQASAHMVTVLDNMLDMIINRMGRQW